MHLGIQNKAKVVLFNSVNKYLDSYAGTVLGKNQKKPNFAGLTFQQGEKDKKQ